MASTPNEHYYIEKNGLIVFTEKYHLDRGYCCHNGCRHCPYKKKPIDKNNSDTLSGNAESGSGEALPE